MSSFRSAAHASLALVALALGAVHCGAAAPAPAAPTSAAPAREPHGPPLAAKELGVVGPGQCATAPFIAQMGAGCQGEVARTANGAGKSASNVADGDACSVWNSGGTPPQSVVVDLEKQTTFTRLLLVPEMTPPEGDVVHVIERSDDGDAWKPVGVFKGHMTDDHAYGVTLPSKVTTRFIRVTTHASPSWVAWAEIEPVVCASE